MAFVVQPIIKEWSNTTKSHNQCFTIFLLSKRNTMIYMIILTTIFVTHFCNKKAEDGKAHSVVHPETSSLQSCTHQEDKQQQGHQLNVGKSWDGRRK